MLNLLLTVLVIGALGYLWGKVESLESRMPAPPQAPEAAAAPTSSAVSVSGTSGNNAGSPCGPGKPTVDFLDNFSGSSSLSNYIYYPLFSGNPTSAQDQGFSVANGELLDSPAQTYVLLKNEKFPFNMTHYTVEADFKMETRSTNNGLFGLTFLEQPNDAGYVFEWNGNWEHNPPHWQVQKDPGSSGNGFTYLPPAGFGKGKSDPEYKLGTWAHLKVVVAKDGTFNCSVNLNDGKGEQLVYSVKDTLGNPFTMGGVGFREVMAAPNQLHMRNFHVFGCND